MAAEYTVSVVLPCKAVRYVTAMGNVGPEKLSCYSGNGEVVLTRERAQNMCSRGQRHHRLLQLISLQIRDTERQYTVLILCFGHVI